MNTPSPERAPVAGAISFAHRLTPAREDDTGQDAAGREWIVFRLLRGGGNVTREWFVLVVLGNQTVRVLTTRIGMSDEGIDEVGVLYDLDARPGAVARRGAGADGHRRIARADPPPTASGTTRRPTITEDRMSRPSRTKTPTAAQPHDALLAAIIRQAVTDYQDAIAPHDQSAAQWLCDLGVLDADGHRRVRGRDWDGLRTTPGQRRRLAAAVDDG